MAEYDPRNEPIASPPPPQAAGQPPLARASVVQPRPAQSAPAPPPVVNPVPRTTDPAPPARDDGSPEPAAPAEVRLYSHSALFYWWPVWVVGYVMALVTWWHGQQHQIGGAPELYHPSSNPGVIFFLTLTLVILITNVSVRGLASGMVVMAVILIVVLLAYFGWWDEVLGWVGDLQIHLNFGAYFWFSTFLFLIWASTVFVFDRLSYWNVKPGQITQEFVFGAGSNSYDTDGMMLEKHRNDLFRHWILGLGAGDLRIHTTGATREVIDVPNVLFLGSKVAAVQRMIATKPDEFGRATVK